MQTATPKACRRVNLGQPVNGIRALHLSIPKGRKVEHFGYYLLPLASDFGRSFRFEKFAAEQVDGETASYDVQIDAAGFHRCECQGFQRWNHCKHVESVLALIKQGKL